MISRELLNRETLKAALLSDSMKEHFDSKFDEAVDKYSRSDETVGSMIGKYFEQEKVQKKLDDVKDALALTIARRAVEQDIGKAIADYAYDEIMAKTKPILKSLTGSALKSVKQPFASTINDMIASRSKPLIEKFLGDEADELINMPLNEIIARYRERIPDIKMYAWNMYEEIITKKLADVLDTVGIAGVVRNRIDNFELPEFESIIMALMKKELNAIIWLGGLLGLVMGFVNVLI